MEGNFFVNGLAVCFKVFDLDGDGFLSRSELESMMKALLQIKLDNSGERVWKPIIQNDLNILFYFILFVGD